MQSQLRVQNIGQSNHGFNLVIFPDLPDLFDPNVKRRIIVVANGQTLADVSKDGATPPDRIMLPYLMQWQVGFEILKSLNLPWDSPPVSAYLGDFRNGNIDLSKLLGSVTVTYTYGATSVVKSGTMVASPGSPTLEVRAPLS